jgi:hypothetical protein
MRDPDQIGPGLFFPADLIAVDEDGMPAILAAT